MKEKDFTTFFLTTYSIEMYFFGEGSEDERDAKEAQRWGDRPSWAWTRRLDQCTHTKLNPKSLVTFGLRHELQQTLKSLYTGE